MESNTVLGSLSSGYHEMLCQGYLTKDVPEFSGGFTSHLITTPLQWLPFFSILYYFGVG